MKFRWRWLQVVCLMCCIQPALTLAAQVDIHKEPDILMEQGWTLFRQGAFEEAGVSWTQAAQLYALRDDLAQQTEAVTYLAFAYESLGQYRKALQQLELALALAQRSKDEARIALILGRTGNEYLALGQVEAAERFLAEAIDHARALNDRSLLASLLNDDGNLYAAKGEYGRAADAYMEAASAAKAVKNPSMASTALVNQARSLHEQGQRERVKALLDEARVQVTDTIPSHEKAYTLIAIGLAYDDLARSLKDDGEARRLAVSCLTEAATFARTLKDARAESYALGYLGSIAEKEGRPQEALELSRKAVTAAQSVHAPESLYRWHWQTGRLLKRMGDPDGAVAAYRRAVALLQSIRPEMAASSGIGRSLFRDSIAPVYFELADLLLQQAAAKGDKQQIEPLLIEARDTVESLKAAELRDYFRDDCVDGALTRVTKLDVVSPTAAAIYPILLPDRIELLVSLPQGMKQVTVPIPAERVTGEIRVFRSLLEKRTTRQYLPHAQQLYDWLIRPLVPDLERQGIDTLVIVPDGALRTIPMAALHDGRQFLIAKYAVATSPGLNLTDPRPMRQQAIKVLIAGLTESVQGFPALPNVASEMKAIQEIYGADVMVDKDFQANRFGTEMKDKEPTLVHIASHGEFKNAVDQSFILTHDDKLTMDKLNEYIGLLRFRKEPLELLTLSACETAAGDDRAALGMAGIAIKAGARSALATLWSINDEASSDLIGDFYRELQKPGTSKAIALQHAQVKLLSDPRYQHPGYWSPFLLLSNWL